MFAPKTMLVAFETQAAQFIEPCQNTLLASDKSDGVIHLDATSFSECPSDSIDFAIMEKADNVVLVAPVDIGWNDIGSWSALYDLHSRPQDHESNVETGDVLALDCKNSLFHSNGPLITGIGLEGMVVVATEDAVIVLPKDRSQDIKSIITALKANDRTDVL